MPDDSVEIVGILRELVELEKQKASRNARSARWLPIGIVALFVVLTAIEQRFQKQIYESYVSTTPILRSSADSLWQNATNGAWILVFPTPCPNCRGPGPFYRRHARAAVDLAVQLQHDRTADFRDAALCAEATASVVNIIAIMSGRRDPLP